MIGVECSLERDCHAEGAKDQEDALTDEERLDQGAVIFVCPVRDSVVAFVLSTKFSFRVESPAAGSGNDCKLDTASESKGNARANEKLLQERCEN